MKYAIRALKYFIYITIIFSFVLWALVSIQAHRLVSSPADIVNGLEHGINSVWLILAVFAAFSCLYPMMGYMKRRLEFAGSIAENRQDIVEFMDERDYELETETDELISFRLRNKTSRATRMWEDRVTIFQSARGLEMEGLRKDIVRLANGLEWRVGRSE